MNQQELRGRLRMLRTEEKVLRARQVEAEQRFARELKALQTTITAAQKELREVKTRDDEAAERLAFAQKERDEAERLDLLNKEKRERLTARREEIERANQTRLQKQAESLLPIIQALLNEVNMS